MMRADRPAIEVRLRQAETSDAPSLAALQASAFDQPWGAIAFATFLADRGSLCLIATEARSDAVIGSVLARMAADEAEIMTIAVAPDRQRGGVGRRLMQAACALLAARGARRLFLEVGVGNRSALALYARLGFCETGRRKAYYRNSAEKTAEDAIVMACDLDRWRDPCGGPMPATGL